MHITLTPRRADVSAPVIVRNGDVLTIDGVVLDLSPLPDGGTLPSDALDLPEVAALGGPWIEGDVHRIDGALHVTLVLPHAADAPESVRYPAAIVDPPDGVVLLPGGDGHD